MVLNELPESYLRMVLTRVGYEIDVDMLSEHGNRTPNRSRDQKPSKICGYSGIQIVAPKKSIEKAAIESPTANILFHPLDPRIPARGICHQRQLWYHFPSHDKPDAHDQYNSYYIVGRRGWGQRLDGVLVAPCPVGNCHHRSCQADHLLLPDLSHRNLNANVRGARKNMRASNKTSSTTPAE